MLRDENRECLCSKAYPVLRLSKIIGLDALFRHGSVAENIR